MKLLDRIAAAVTAAVLGVCMFTVLSGPTHVLAADHRDGPGVDGKGEGDITDVYTFTDPNDPTRVVFVLNVNSFAVPGEGTSYFFSPEYLYTIKIDNTGDAKEDLVIQAVTDRAATTQVISVYGPIAPTLTGTRTVLSSGTPSAQGTFNTTFGSASGVQVYAGLRDDPFVFDFSQFSRILNGSQDLFRAVGTSFRGRPTRASGISGIDTFGGFDLTSLVVSVPKSMVRGTSSKINVWATVSERVPTRRGTQTFDQFERMGQQAFATVFIPSGPMRDAYNSGTPADDVTVYSAFVPDALTTTDNDGSNNTIASRASLLGALGLTALPNGAPLLLPGTFGNTSKDLLRIALLPDVLRLDLDLPYSNLAIGQFGLQNGRQLDYHSVDIALQLLRQLADVKFPGGAGIPGGGPLGTRAALDCLGYPQCGDRRVLVVLQGTDWTRPDSMVGTPTPVGNDQPFATTFPFVPVAHPFPGDANTVGFPPQK